MYKKYFYIITLFFSLSLLSQNIKVKSVISENTITNFSNQKLILIDFWATWCAPCITATQQLEFLQEEFKDELFIVSISDESKEVIQKFQKRKEMKLMVLEDYKNYTFDKHNVLQRPYSVLINTKGTVLWTGHPSDLSKSMIVSFARRSRNLKSYPLSEIIQVQDEEQKAPTSKKEDWFKLVDKYSLTDDDLLDKDIFEDEGNICFTGDITSFVASFFDLSLFQLEGDKEVSDTYFSLKIKRKNWDESKYSYLDSLQNKLHFKIDKNIVKRNVKEISLANLSKLWSNKQIEWGSDYKKVIIDPERIKADNFTLKQLTQVLSSVKNDLYYYEGESNTTYDWDFHYLNEKFFIEDLSDNFGIKIKDEVKEIPFYKISKQL